MCCYLIYCYSAFSVKLWYPQILQAINDFHNENANVNPNICDILNSLTNRNETGDNVCTVVSIVQIS